MLYLLWSLTVLSLWVAGIVGWIANIVQVINMMIADSPVGALFIGKIVGIFAAPLGSVLGLYGLFA